MREKGVKITPVAKNVMNYYDVDVKDVAYSNNKITKNDVMSAVGLE